jgi:hypothetical protein
MSKEKEEGRRRGGEEEEEGKEEGEKRRVKWEHGHTRGPRQNKFRGGTVSWLALRNVSKEKEGRGGSILNIWCAGGGRGRRQREEGGGRKGRARKPDSVSLCKSPQQGSPEGGRGRGTILSKLLQKVRIKASPINFDLGVVVEGYNGTFGGAGKVYGLQLFLHESLTSLENCTAER